MRVGLHRERLEAPPFDSAQGRLWYPCRHFFPINPQTPLRSIQLGLWVRNKPALERDEPSVRKGSGAGAPHCEER
jgi:hypothetical protein